MNTSKKRVVVIGGVAGGMSAAAKAAREDPALEVVVYERSGFISYGACGMPYVISGEIPSLERLIARTPERMAEQGVAAHVRHEVTAVDAARRCVTVKNLDTGAVFSDRYDALVLATGARPIRLRVPGAELPGVHTLRQLEDAAAIQGALARGAKRAVVVGGSYIGLELAEAFVKAGLAVRVLERGPQLLSSFGPVAADAAREELAAAGVALELGAEVTAFEGAGRLERVITAQGEVPTDIVLVAVGVQPSAALAQALGLALGPSGAVLTDEQLRTSVPDIYAVGDVSAAHHLVTGAPAWVPLGDTANKQGRVAGSAIAGQPARFRGVVGTGVTKVFARAFATTGLTHAAAEAAGLAAQSRTVETTDHAGYYPDKRPLSVTLVWERGSARLLGAQLTGYGDAVKRVDVVAALLFQGGTLQDLADLDLAYAPPFSSAWDPLLVAANAALG